MKQFDKNVLGSQTGWVSETLETQFKNHRNHISTAISAEMNCNSLEPNHYSRKQKFAVQALLLSAILMAVNTSVFAEPSCNANQDTGDCPGTGIPGADGLSAYELAKTEAGGSFQGSLTDWLISLEGEDGKDGKSAYEIANQNGDFDSEQDWLDSLKGDPGNDGKSAYEIANQNGDFDSEQDWLDSLKGDPGNDGKSAYEIANQNGDFDSEQDWLDSLKGADGISAYQIAVEALSFTPDSTQTEAQNILEWLKSLKGEDGTNGITPEVMAAADTVTLNEAKTYVDQVGQQTLNDAKAYTDSRVDALNRDMRKLEDKTYAAVASSIAIASLPQPTEPGMSMVSAGVGTWEGEQGYAFGLSGVTENNKYVYKVAITGNSESDFGAGASIGYQWK